MLSVVWKLIYAKSRQSTVASGRPGLSSGPVYRVEERGVSLSGTGWLMVEQYSRWTRGCPLIDVDEKRGLLGHCYILPNARAYEIFTRRMEIDVHPSKRILSPVTLLRTTRKNWTCNYVDA